MNDTQKYFLRILSFDPNTVDAEYVAEALLENWTGSNDQIETILSMLLGNLDSDLSYFGATLTLNNEPITSFEMFSIINLLESMRNENKETE